jgi:hypothetical protein
VSSPSSPQLSEAPPARASAPSPRTVALGLALLAVGVVIAVVIDPVLAWDDDNVYLGKGRLFLYFTTQSNILAAAAFIAVGVTLLRGRRPGAGLELLRGLATVDMAITGIVNGALLADPAAPWNFSEFVLHIGGPILIALWWILLPPERPLPFRSIAIWLAHPVIWTASVLTYAAESSDNWVPYFFMDPAEMDGMAGVLGTIAIIHVVFVVLAALAVLRTRVRRRQDAAL